MAITADIRQQVFDLLSRASNLSFVGAEQESVGRIGLTPGQKVTAEVLSAFSDGRVQVGIGEELFNLELPMAVRPGQSLEMTFVSSEPRSTFAIARPASPAPLVSLSDASRLLALLAEGERISDPALRASLKSVGEILQRSPGDAGVLASLMDQALTYGGTAEGSRPGSGIPSGSPALPRSGTVTASPQGEAGAASGRLPLTGFESGASRILQQIARSSSSILVEAVNPPLMPLSLTPGDEVDALVLGTLPGGRVFVRVTGAELELLLPRPVQESEILRLTVVASQPRPLFAILRSSPDPVQGALSDAGRWLSVLEQSGGGLSDQQKYVLDRLTTIMKSLPADSPAFTAILDEPITYRQATVPAHTVEQQQGLMVAAPATPPQGSGIVISDDMAKLLQALIKGNRLTLLEALNQQSPPHGFEPGMQLKGDVLASLGAGRFLIQVAEQAFEFALPKGIRPGERLTLFYITDQPRISFLMTRFGRPGDSRVSEAGRWLSGFLGTAPEALAAGEPLGILRTLLLGPPSDAPRVATLLQQGLRESGLFYESHLARWFEDDYRLEDLLREPQGRLSRLGQPDASLLVEQGRPDERPAFEVSGRLTPRAEAAIGKSDGDTGDGPVVDRASLAVVREQLETLQSGQVVYRGELFAGQKMEWSVGDRETGRNASGGRERGWDSELRLDLPRLGAISARLKLDGLRISIELSTGSPDSAVSLEEGKQSLVEQLQAAGLEPAGIGIRHVGP